PGHRATAPTIARADLYDSGALTTPARLIGRKVAINGKATALEYQIAELLDKGGLRMSDVDIVTMPFADMIPALANKSIDAALMAEPTASQVVAKGIARILAEEYAPNFQIQVVV